MPRGGRRECCYSTAPIGLLGGGREGGGRKWKLKALARAYAALRSSLVELPFASLLPNEDLAMVVK